MVAAFVVVVATCALFIVLAGFAGLKDFGLSFSNSFDPDLKIVPATGKTFDLNDAQLTKLENNGQVAAFSKVVEERVFLNFRQKSHIAYLKGVDLNYNKVNAIDSIVGLGTWLEEDQSQVVIGYGISDILNLSIFDFSELLEIIVPKPGKGSITSSAKRPYVNKMAQTVGIYMISEDLDKKYVFSDIQFARDLLNLKENQVSSIEIKSVANVDEDALKNELQTLFGNQVIIKNRAQLNDALYKMLNTENIAIYLIFTLVLIIALFNVIGSIIMMILDKKANLNTLFNLGATVKDIKRVFFLQGMLLTVLGGLAGIFIGLLLVWLQKTFSLLMITPSLPYPVELKALNVLIVFATIVLLGIIASKIASSRITRKLIA